MKSSVNLGFTEEASAGAGLPAHEHGPEFIANNASVPEPSAKIIVRFPREQEMPVSVTLARLSDAARLNSFRGFGINE